MVLIAHIRRLGAASSTRWCRFAVASVPRMRRATGAPPTRRRRFMGRQWRETAAFAPRLAFHAVVHSTFSTFAFTDPDAFAQLRRDPEAPRLGTVDFAIGPAQRARGGLTLLVLRRSITA